MLIQLTINNFAIVDKISVDFYGKMTAITGETGAGKSIAIDALGLCLGGRSDTSIIQKDHDRADISAHFILDHAPAALNWLKENQLDDHNDCILRRVVSLDGRSKAFINGRSVPITQLKEVGQLLIQIHGQHEHQRLLKHDYQQQLLNQYLDEKSLLSDMSQAYKKWKNATLQYQQHQQACQEREAHLSLLQYQLKELNEFSPIEGEYEQMDEEYKRLANSEQLISTTQQSLALLTDNDESNIANLLSNIKMMLQQLIDLDPNLNNIYNMLEEASIQIEEASYELRNYAEHIEVEPARAIQLEQRLSKQITLARKHHISPELLPEQHKKLLDEYTQLINQDEFSEELKVAITQYHQQALQIASLLHKKRSSIGKILAAKITSTIKELSIPNGQFSIHIDYDETKLSDDGADQVTFMISTNLGQPLQPMAKVASGGELSRIALAILVLTAQKMDTPALIFDEIDVGISGPTAAKVGHLLRQLGESTQVITVTHLPQVAGNAHHHYFVDKQTHQQKTTTSMIKLDKQARIHELARLLGGDKITENTLANAEELLTKDQ